MGKEWIAAITAQIMQRTLMHRAQMAIRGDAVEAAVELLKDAELLGEVHTPAAK